MFRLFNILILNSFFAIINGHVLVDESGDREKTVDSALKFMKLGLQEHLESIERMVIKRLEGVEDIVEEKITQMIRNATGNIAEDQTRNISSQSTGQNEKISENLLSNFQTEEQDNNESPITRLSMKVDKKISDLFFTTQIEQRLFRQDIISVTDSFFGKLEKIDDVLSTTQNEQQLLSQEIESLSTNLFDNVNKQISDELSTIQTEHRILKQEVVSLTSNLVKKVDAKISEVMGTSKDQFLTVLKNIETKAQEMNDLQNSLIALNTEYSKEELKSGDFTDFLLLYNESLSTVQSEQQLLRHEMASITTNFSDRVDEKLSYLISTFQTKHLSLSEEMVSFANNMSGVVDISWNRKISNLKKAFDRLSGQLQNEQIAEISMFKSIVSKANQTISVCTTKIGEEYNNVETNLENVFRDGMKNLSLNLENENAKSKIILANIRNTSLHMTKQLSSGEFMNMLRNVEVISQSLLKIHEIVGYSCAFIFLQYPGTRWKNGVYYIKDKSIKKQAVYCDMTTDKGGWTVIQRRVNGSVDFNRNWTEYKNGFGFADHEYWIGNDVLHEMAGDESFLGNHQTLRVDMEQFNGEKTYAVYSTFFVENEASKYYAKVGRYSGDAGDGLRDSNKMMFSTPDQDNDMASDRNCASHWRTAGWFNNCFHANPNGPYTDSEKNEPNKYIQWYDRKRSYIPLKTITLMIRPETWESILNEDCLTYITQKKN